MQQQEPIEIKFTFHSAEQALHVMEAYRESQAFVTNNHYTKPGPVVAERPTVPAAAEKQTAEPSSQAPVAGGPNPGQSASPAAGATSHGEKDARGVPFNAEYHSGEKSAAGNWNYRRNRKEPGQAWEAQFLQPGQQVPAAAPAASADALPPGVTPPALSARDRPDGGASLMYPGEAEKYTPSEAEYDAKWVELCKGQKVTGEHQKFLEETFGGHPLKPSIMSDPLKRQAIWIRFMDWQNGHKGF